MSNLEVKWPFMGTLNWTEEDHMTVKLTRRHFDGMGMIERYIDRPAWHRVRDFLIIVAVITSPGLLAMTITDFLVGDSHDWIVSWVGVVVIVAVGVPMVYVVFRGRKHLDQDFFQRCLDEGVEILPPDDEPPGF